MTDEDADAERLITRFNMCRRHLYTLMQVTGAYYTVQSQHTDMLHDDYKNKWQMV